MKEYMRNRWVKRRLNAIAQLGGKCVTCGTTENLEFDHKDASLKSFSLGKFSSCSEVKWQAELSKCRLLCKSCHLNKTVACGDLGNVSREMPCNCGKIFDSIKAYAGHKTWCKA